MVRERAGIPGVEESWAMSETPGKVNSREGFREIIQQERLIAMALEGSRYWDLLRWKRAESVINQPVRGWDVGQIETQLISDERRVGKELGSTCSSRWSPSHETKKEDKET